MNKLVLALSLLFLISSNTCVLPEMCEGNSVQVEIEVEPHFTEYHCNKNIFIIKGGQWWADSSAFHM